MNTNPSQNNQTLKQISSIEECEAQLIENIIESIYLSLFDTKLENLTPEDRELLLQCFSDYESAIKPKLEQYLKQASTFLKGKPVLMDTVLECLSVAQSEFEPIGDVRGSAQYKRLLARQLLLANFVKLFPESIDQEALYAAL